MFTPLVKSEERMLPFEEWLPFNPLISPNYEIVIISQVLNQFVTVLVFANVDCMFMGTIILTTAQFKLLRMKLRNIHYTALLRAGVPRKMVYKLAMQYNHYGNNR